MFRITSDGSFDLFQTTVACLGGLGFHHVWRFYDAQIWQMPLLPGSFMKLLCYSIQYTDMVTFFFALNKCPFTNKNVINCYLPDQAAKHPFTDRVLSISNFYVRTFGSHTISKCYDNL